jgi:hypothetical protein
VTNPYDPFRQHEATLESFSGSGIVRGAQLGNNPFEGARKRVLNVRRPLMQQFGGCDGLCSVHVGVRDFEEPLPGPGRRNGMLMLSLSWGAGMGGGDALVDATQGSTFTVGASQAFSIDAFFMSAIVGDPLRAFIDKYVELSAHWGTSQNPIKAFSSLPGVGLVAGVPSAFFRIPSQARSMMAVSDVPAFLAGTVAEFATEPAAGGIIYRTPNPLQGTPIGHGVEFVRLVSVNPHTVLMKFELWL